MLGTGLADCLDLEADALVLLDVADDLAQVAGVGVARRSEHAHEALGRLAGEGAELFESDRGVDVIAKQDLAGVGVAGKQGFDAFGQQALPKGRVALSASLHGFFEVTSEGHRLGLSAG